MTFTASLARERERGSAAPSSPERLAQRLALNVSEGIERPSPHSRSGLDMRL